MPLNIPGLLVSLQLLWNPRVVLPHVIVTDIRQLDFLALRKAGYRGAVFDKDNCLTVPHKDSLVPELQAAWTECREVFGEGNVVIVSNSAGSKQDPGEIQAESVSHYLSVPVLRHNSPKPAYSCIQSIRAYFSTLRVPIKDDELVVVGDRIFTDIVMANRMRRRVSLKPSTDRTEPETESPPPFTPPASGPLAVWTTGIWQKESMAVRWFEKRLVNIVTHIADDPARRSAFQMFVKPLPSPEVTKEAAVLSKVWRTLKRCSTG
ncbi:HAD phosphatase [Melanogaster broomeanus]|nr:HAD phosphatase [Melanogaster broomeanus]